MKYVKTLTLAAVIIALIGGYSLAEVTPKPQTICPVMGGKIDKNIYTDYEGKRVYFCCPACIPEFKKDPAKYIKKLEDESVVLEKIPTTGSQENPSQDKPKGCGDCGGCS
jgi:YHS domain-containing protein